MRVLAGNGSPSGSGKDSDIEHLFGTGMMLGFTIISKNFSYGADSSGRQAGQLLLPATGKESGMFERLGKRYLCQWLRIPGIGEVFIEHAYCGSHDWWFWHGQRMGSTYHLWIGGNWYVEFISARTLREGQKREARKG